MSDWRPIEVNITPDPNFAPITVGTEPSTVGADTTRAAVSATTKPASSATPKES